MGESAEATQQLSDANTKLVAVKAQVKELQSRIAADDNVTGVCASASSGTDSRSSRYFDNAGVFIATPGCAARVVVDPSLDLEVISVGNVPMKIVEALSPKRSAAALKKNFFTK